MAALLVSALPVTVQATFVGADSPDPVGEMLVRWSLFAVVLGSRGGSVATTALL